MRVTHDMRLAIVRGIRSYESMTQCATVPMTPVERAALTATIADSLEAMPDAPVVRATQAWTGDHASEA